MLFSSPIFLFCFLPAVLLGYYLFKPELRNGFLLVCNLIFYGWGEPVYVALMAVSILMNYEAEGMEKKSRVKVKKRRGEESRWEMLKRQGEKSSDR